MCRCLLSILINECKAIAFYGVLNLFLNFVLAANNNYIILKSQ